MGVRGAARRGRGLYETLVFLPLVIREIVKRAFLPVKSLKKLDQEWSSYLTDPLPHLKKTGGFAYAGLQSSRITDLNEPAREDTRPPERLAPECSPGNDHSSCRSSDVIALQDNVSPFLPFLYCRSRTHHYFPSCTVFLLNTLREGIGRLLPG